MKAKGKCPLQSVVRSRGGWRDVCDVVGALLKGQGKSYSQFLADEGCNKVDAGGI